MEATKFIVRSSYVSNSLLNVAILEVYRDLKTIPRIDKRSYGVVSIIKLWKKVYKGTERSRYYKVIEEANKLCEDLNYTKDIDEMKNKDFLDELIEEFGADGLREALSRRERKKSNDPIENLTLRKMLKDRERVISSLKEEIEMLKNNSYDDTIDETCETADASIK